MMTASVRSPTKADAPPWRPAATAAGNTVRFISTGHARARCERTAFGPTTLSRRFASSSGRP